MIFKAIVTAFQFLTTIPIRTTREVSEKEVCNAVSFFPLVGAVQGLFLALLAFVFLKIFSADITAALVLVFSVLMTGGFHQDGLSDTFDALSVPSSGDKKRDKEKRLQVMKDSTVGPMGVIAIILSLLLQYVLLKEALRISSYGQKYFIILLMPVFSKWAMVTGMYHGRSARMDGIGKTFLEHTGLKQIASATALLVFVTFLAVYVSHYISMTWFPLVSASSFILFSFSELVFIFLVCLILKYVFTARFGGLTGDNFGAMHEISTILFLSVALLWR